MLFKSICYFKLIGILRICIKRLLVERRKGMLLKKLNMFYVMYFDIKILKKFGFIEGFSEVLVILEVNELFFVIEKIMFFVWFGNVCYEG